ncbi:DUF6578 domain-containing protein [Streptomyces sp. NPDC001034]|uniref:DUF6578 domain-containing protein n=1 Tax=Streptomyces sp. NPDC001034 TaxID=3154375 RepID=UPI00332A9933
MPQKSVFYADWQLACCGTSFAVDDEVTWTLVAYDAKDRRDGVGHGAEAWVEHHGGPDEQAVGRVRAIELVHQEYTYRPAAPEPAPRGRGVVLRAAGRGLEPVPGSVTMEPADGCPRWFEETDLGTAQGLGRVRRTVGVLVTLDITGSARRVR